MRERETWAAELVKDLAVLWKETLAVTFIKRMTPIFSGLI
ncbi:hypothetical protein SJ05684_c34400 [Sinorhizobium sojae CCBAU 05684]|uniref:Uncharacterized protein n=1 Tax=Sinorhizobium sojae CCBAU 05684 TaxID=716928 RepID=A0A249PE68_9HYPH|nr:hypothetical protein SJ05684_c26220 [Sinorhizobium sojae CCBAU 05684]ASY64421.1 hypothetical protein SJ05684_c29970 [Sinorhizobium sojae CCBAU 05684]ASY64862.1 hypothetical protein SJ05684_c34400 [Sinorhizobium sojae CCBAU 05684]